MLPQAIRPFRIVPGIIGNGVGSTAGFDALGLPVDVLAPVSAGGGEHVVVAGGADALTVSQVCLLQAGDEC